MLVLTVLAFAAIVGLAMLSTASMQAQTTANSSLALSADALADSGVDLACYYLVNPTKAPKFVAMGGYYDGGTISFGPNMPGSVDLTITPVAGGNAGDYKVISVGKAAWSGLTHTVTANVHVDTGWTAKSLVGLSNGGNTSLLTTINGDVQSNGSTIALTNLGKITGSVISLLSAGGSGLITLGTIAPNEQNKMTIPVWANVRDFTSYSYRGKSYNAVLITGLPTGTTLSPSDTNPAGIFKYSTGTLTMNHNVTINGTLIVDNGDLNISGGGNRITPVDGFPALVVKSNLYLRFPLIGTSPRDLTANGVVWLGGSVKMSGLLNLGAFLEIDGALLFGGGGSVDTLFTSKLTVNANANKTTNINIDITVPPAGAKVLSYKQ